MKQLIPIGLVFLTFAACNQSTTKSDTDSEKKASYEVNPTYANLGMIGSLTGEWKQAFTCYDKNSNGQLEPEERVPATNMLGFDYFRFNDDGTCLRDSDIKFKGTYDVAAEGGKIRLNIHTNPPGETYSYTINNDISYELIMMDAGTFLVYKRQ